MKGRFRNISFIFLWLSLGMIFITQGIHATHCYTHQHIHITFQETENCCADEHSQVEHTKGQAKMGCCSTEKISSETFYLISQNLTKSVIDFQIAYITLFKPIINFAISYTPSINYNCSQSLFLCTNTLQKLCMLLL